VTTNLVKIIIHRSLTVTDETTANRIMQFSLQRAKGGTVSMISLKNEITTGFPRLGALLMLWWLRTLPNRSRYILTL